MINPYGDILNLSSPALTSAQVSLQDALILLTNEGADITVKAICGRAFVARSTFYAYYQNVDELLEAVEDRLIYALVRQNDEIMNPDVHDKEDMRFYARTLEFINDNRDAVYAMLLARPNARFIEKWKNAIKYHLWERLARGGTLHDGGLILELAASSVITAYTYWLKNSNEIDPERVYGIISLTLRIFDNV